MSGKRPNGDNSIYQYDDRWFVQGMVHGVRRRSAARPEPPPSPRGRTAGDPCSVEPQAAPRCGQMGSRQWFDLCRSNWTYKTTVTYRTALDRQINPLLGSKRTSRR